MGHIKVIKGFNSTFYVSKFGPPSDRDSHKAINLSLHSVILWLLLLSKQTQSLFPSVTSMQCFYRATRRCQTGLPCGVMDDLLLCELVACRAEPLPTHTVSEPVNHVNSASLKPRGSPTTGERDWHQTTSALWRSHEKPVKTSAEERSQKAAMGQSVNGERSCRPFTAIAKGFFNRFKLWSWPHMWPPISTPFQRTGNPHEKEDVNILKTLLECPSV